VIERRTNRRELVVTVNCVHVRTRMSGQLHPELLRHAGVDKNRVERVPQAVKRKCVNGTTYALGAGSQLAGNNAGLFHDSGKCHT
jgi:hypothetical protein